MRYRPQYQEVDCDDPHFAGRLPTDTDIEGGLLTVKENREPALYCAEVTDAYHSSLQSDLRRGLVAPGLLRCGDDVGGLRDVHERLRRRAGMGNVGRGHLSTRVRLSRRGECCTSAVS